MTRSNWLAGLALGVLAAAPAAADRVLTIQRHSDAMTMMGHTTPAQDTTNAYWFGDDRIRFEGGDTTVILRLDTKKLYMVDNLKQTYSPMDLPIDFKQLVGPEMAPMMDKMMAMMKPTVTVTPTDRTGNYAGFACKFYKVDMTMSMMQVATEQCMSEDVPIDYSRYKAFSEAQSQLAPNAAWIKELAEKLKGFPVRTESTSTMMGKSFGSWQELKSVEDKPAPAGIYEPPAGYREVKFDPMAQQGQPRSHN